MTQVFLELDHEHPERLAPTSGEAVLFSTKALDKSTPNEDAALFGELAGGVRLLAVADGIGGQPAGAEAAATAVAAVRRAVERSGERPDRDRLRSAIFDAFEDANERLLDQGVGAGTTLVVVEVRDGAARAYHAGDSGALLVGQRGRVRLQTIPHSPVGYGVAAGMLEPDDTHHHDERHLLSNCVGSRDMRVEIGAPVRMAARDTLLLATDGVLENIERRDLIDQIRSGPLLRAATSLQARLRRTMAGGDPKLPAHPDDATALLFRLVADRARPRGPKGRG
ncbi:MAG: protein phosphatase 2C domain-containing protein [Myxococcota bacterium]